MNQKQEKVEHSIALTPLPHSPLLLSYLINKVSELEKCHSKLAVTINFKDTSYTPYDGGYHPVEIRLSKLDQQNTSRTVWQLEYITDFAYQGHTFPELARDIDFDFANGCFYSVFLGWKTIKGNQDAIELYTLWESNFLSYLDMDAFDSISVKAD
ncbi:DUF2787 domain-containing protein [Vibrio sp. TBV020]|uniref:DUF2787 domain-containing protein n=1 Tax=Vibrio sp. TBV020 TaxID=3137398 RepID=UPI0038CD4690